MGSPMELPWWNCCICILVFCIWLYWIGFAWYRTGKIQTWLFIYQADMSIYTHTHPYWTCCHARHAYGKYMPVLQPKRSAYGDAASLSSKVYRSLEEAREEASRKEAETEATKERVKVLEDKVNRTNPICVRLHSVLHSVVQEDLERAQNKASVKLWDMWDMWEMEFRHVSCIALRVSLRVAEDPLNLWFSMSGWGIRRTVFSSGGRVVGHWGKNQWRNEDMFFFLAAVFICSLATRATSIKFWSANAQECCLEGTWWEEATTWRCR